MPLIKTDVVVFRIIAAPKVDIPLDLNELNFDLEESSSEV